MWTVALFFECGDPDVRVDAIRSAAYAVSNGELVVLPTDTVYGLGANAFDAPAVADLLRRQGPRAGHARPRARRVMDHDRRAGQRRRFPHPRPHRGVLARRPDAGRQPRAVPQLGPWGFRRNGRRSDAAASRRHRAARGDRARWPCPAPTGTGSRPRRPRPRRGPSSATTWRSTSRTGRSAAASPRPSSTSPADGRRSCALGAIDADTLREVVPDIVGGAAP